MRAALRRAAGRGFMTWVSSLLVLSFVSALPSLGALGKKEPTPEQTEWWGKFSQEVRIEEVQQHVTTISDFNPRLAGYPGAEQAAEYIVDELGAWG